MDGLAGFIAYRHSHFEFNKIPDILFATAIVDGLKLF